MSGSDAIRIEAVSTKAGMDAFIRVPFHLYQDDPAWVPPLMFERREAFSEKHNPYFEHAKAAFWVAYDGDQPVGRICAQVDDLFLEKFGSKAGHFGLIEAVDDTKVFRALFETAESWLKDQGMTEIMGPFNFNTNEECGLLVDGFETPPNLMMGHAKPYYGARVQELGFRKAKDLLAYYCRIADDLPRGVKSLAAKIEADDEIVIRHLRMKSLKEEVAIIVDIFNDAWADNWAMVPFTEAEAGALASTLRPIIIADMVGIAEINGEPMGMFICLPNLNAAIGDLDGKLLPFGWAKLLWRLKIAGVKDSRVPLMGIKKEYQGTMIGSAITFGLIKVIFDNAARRGFLGGELSWILEDNMPIRRVIEGIGAEVYKTYRIYQKPIQ